MIGAVAARQHGVVARRQLLAAGLSPSMIDRRAQSGHLVPLHRGVYAVGHRRLRRQGHWLAAVLAVGPGAVLSHRHAAALHGIRSVAASRIDVSTPRQRGAQTGIRVYGRRIIHPVEITTVDAIPVTSVARTLVDLAGVLGSQQLERAVSEAERLRRFDLASVEQALAHTRGRRAFQDDRTKANDLTAAGYTVLRFTYEDVMRRPADVADRISRACESAPPLRRSARRRR